MRRVVLAAGLAVAGVTMVPLQAAEPLRGGYRATARPLARSAVQPLACARSAGQHDPGIDGVGRLEAVVSAPGWIVVVTDGAGRALSGDPYVEPKRVRASARVRRGGKVRIAACRTGAGPASADVLWRFYPGRSEPVTATAAGFRHLAPGQPADLRETVPVNIVLAGYEQHQVDAATLPDYLPQQSRPIERMPNVYGIRREIGLTYTYRYRIVYTDRAWENRFFGYLAEIGVRSAPTLYQRKYNDQDRNLRTITENLRIDGVKVERWLATHPPRGVDTTQDTLFLVNWFGRRDFRHHTYSKMDEPNTDLGFPRGGRDETQAISGGGSAFDDPESGLGRTYRVYFHDLSAGPHYWTKNWDVDSPRTGDNRIPPVWEYDDDGARDPDDLTADLADITRYVAINLLFTASPLYPLSPTFPVQPSRLSVQTNFYELDPRRDMSSTRFFAPALAAAQQRLARELALTAPPARDASWTDPRHLSCYAEQTAIIMQGLLAATPQGCYPEHPYPAWNNSYVHHARTWAPTVKRTSGSHTLGVFVYTPPGELFRNLPSVPSLPSSVPEAVRDLPDQVPWALVPNPRQCFAYADDNGVDGTQSMVFAYLDQCIDEIGSTDLLTHEAGHHLSMSHPHDGYDSEDDAEYAPVGPRRFAFVGTESYTVMNYSFNENEFGQFDYDNRDRWLAASYVTQAQYVAQRVLAKPAARRELRLVDGAIGETKTLIARHRYRDAVPAARRAYQAAWRAASVTKTNIGPLRDAMALVSHVPARSVGLTYANSDAVQVVNGTPLLCQLTGLSMPVPARPERD